MFCHSLAAYSPSSFSELVSNCSKIYMSSSFSRSVPSIPKVFHHLPRFACLHTQLLGYFGFWIRKETKQNQNQQQYVPIHRDNCGHLHEDTKLLQLVVVHCFFPSLNDRMHVPVCVCVFTDICLERETRILVTAPRTANALYPMTDWWGVGAARKCHWTAEPSSPSYLFEAQINIPHQLQWKAGECHNLDG